MKYFEKVTVALCLDDVDRDVLRYTRVLAEIGPEARFSFVHVLPPFGGRSGTRAPRSLGEARTAVEAAVRESFGAHAGHDVLVLDGPHLDKLLETVTEEGSDLIVLGHRRRASGRRSLSRRLAMKAPCSVWMVPEGTQPGIRGVLAAVDFSRSAAHALSLATLIAQRAGHRACSALHVIEPQVTTSGAADRDQVEHEFDGFLAPLDLHGVEVHKRYAESGSLAASAKRHAEAVGADLLVLGTRGRGRSAAVLLGSESEQVLIESTLPVLVTKRTGERLGIVRALFDRDFRAAEPRFG